MTYPHSATFPNLACYWIITKYLSQGFRVETKGAHFYEPLFFGREGLFFHQNLGHAVLPFLSGLAELTSILKLAVMPEK